MNMPYVNTLRNIERDREYEKDVHVAAKEGTNRHRRIGSIS